MLCDFRKAFNPTKEEQENQIKWLKEHQLPNKKNVNLEKSDDILYVSNPLRDFNGQCTQCRNYFDNYSYFCEGGQCELHKFSCGWGFTCDDFCINIKYKGEPNEFIKREL